MGHVTGPKQHRSRSTATGIRPLHLSLWTRPHFHHWVPDRRTATNPHRWRSSPCVAQPHTHTHVPAGAAPDLALRPKTPARRLDKIGLAKGWEWVKVEQLPHVKLLLAEHKISWCPAQHLQIHKTYKRTTAMWWMDNCIIQPSKPRMEECMECHIE